jgi:hypothetical protein
MTTSSFAAGSAPLSGLLHVFVAFDWGDEIDLDKARGLVQASTQELARRRRTPPSFSYRPAPLHIAMPAVRLGLDGPGDIDVPAGLTIFNFAAISVSFRVPFQLTPQELLCVAGGLADPSALVQRARAAVTPFFEALRPAIKDPSWQDDFSEEYFVFQLPPSAMHLATHRDWLAGMVHLESGPLSAEEIHEAVRLKLSYSPSDLFVPDWAAAVLLDQDCDETLQAVEFANLQLLEYRNIDNRLDDVLAQADTLLERSARSRLTAWRGHHTPQRLLGELKVEASGLFERTGNVLKLVGDQYLARVYRLLATRFHLREWERSIERKLEVVEGIYQVISDRSAAFRTEFLEVIIILLIAVEILLTLFFKH